MANVVESQPQRQQRDQLEQPPETPKAIHKLLVSASSFAAKVRNDQGWLHMETAYGPVRFGVTAVDATDMLIKTSGGTPDSGVDPVHSVAIQTDGSSGLHSAVVPKNHRPLFPSIPIMNFVLYTRDLQFQPTDSPILPPPYRYGILIRANETPLFTADRGDFREEVFAMIDSRFTSLPLWGDGISTGSALNAKGRPAEPGWQAVVAPELPAVVEVIFLAFGKGSDAFIAMAGCSVNLSREV